MMIYEIVLQVQMGMNDSTEGVFGKSGPYLKHHQSSYFKLNIITSSSLVQSHKIKNMSTIKFSYVIKRPNRRSEKGLFWAKKQQKSPNNA